MGKTIGLTFPKKDGNPAENESQQTGEADNASENESQQTGEGSAKSGRKTGGIK